MTNALVVFATCSNLDEADRIAGATVEEKLAACVQVLPPVRSIYRWQGELKIDDEILMLFKTTAEKFSALQSRITELHSYETPEILAVPVSAGAEKYLSWLGESTRGT
jgi:periplasmic divalent cation tolerance protein